MSRSNAIRVSMKVQERMNRLSKPYHTSLKTSYNITNESAISLIQPLFNTRVSQDGYDFAIKVMESVDESCRSTIAKAIANNICIGLDRDVEVKYNISDKISKQDRMKIVNAMEETAICDRVITNESRLENRFNINKIMSNISHKSVDYIVNELCSLIDTYDLPSTVKYNVALENIPFILTSKNIKFDKDQDLINMITEYFLMRDMEISDTQYKQMQDILSETKVLDNFDLYGVAHYMMSNPADHYIKEVTEVLSKSKDPAIESFLYKLNGINNEADASEYIKSVSEYIKENDITDNDKAKLYFSVGNIAKTSNISQDFIDIKKNEFFDSDRLDHLATTDMVVSNDRVVQEDEDKFSKIFDKSLVSFGEADDFASSHNVKALVDKFKAEQDKSPNIFKRFFIKLHSKSPESIVDGTPSIMSFVRGGILLAIGTAAPIGVILAGVLGLISWLISTKINDKQAEKLLKYIRKEKKAMKEKLDNYSSDKKKKEVQEYIDCLTTAETRVQDYLDSIVDEDHSDDEEDSDDGGDFDFSLDDDMDFESAVSLTGDIIESANNIADFDPKSIKLEKLVLYCAENYMLHDFSNIVRESSVPMKMYKSALNTVISNNIMSINGVSSINQELVNFEESAEDYSVNHVLLENNYNKLLEQMSYDVDSVNEGALNTLKLAIQKGKAMGRNINTKYQSMWQTMDAHASGLASGIEKAMTSDRREGIIKGSIIPSFSKCCKTAMALAAVGVFAGPQTAAITALGGLAASKYLNNRERKMILDEIDTELHVVEKQIDIAQNENDMNQYRFLLNYQKKLAREARRIKYGIKAVGRPIPSAVAPK